MRDSGNISINSGRRDDIDTEPPPPPPTTRELGLWAILSTMVYAFAMVVLILLLANRVTGLEGALEEVQRELEEVQKTCEAPPPDTIKLEVPAEILALLNKLL